MSAATRSPWMLPQGLVVMVALAAVLMVPVVEAADPTGVVAFAQDDLGNDWRRAQVEEVRTVLARYPGVEFRVSDARGSLALQVKHIEDWAMADVDVLITSPMDSLAMAPVIRQVHEAGIPVILLSRRVAGEAFTSFVHADNRQIARQAGEAVAGALGKDGRVLMLEGVPGASPTRLRREAFLDVVGEYPGIQVVARTANFLRGDAIRVVESLIQTEKGFDFDAVYSQSDSMATGARMALERHGVEIDPLYIVGIDYIGEAREAIRAGRQDLSFTYPTGGERGAELAVELLSGRVVPREVLLESRAVTRENVDQVEPIF
ncbi:MAG: substrate-binding domain-containing protein [Pseudomonadota bacterium]